MSNTIQAKQRYELLDGLRGVAALMVIVYHIYECFPVETWPIGHGYLAVDFFFILSGFVIGYAYDDRWKNPTPALPHGGGSLNVTPAAENGTSIKTNNNAPSPAGEGRGGVMTIWQFFLRRLIRLHPMVVFGVVLGLVCFLLAGGIAWDGTKATISALMIATLMGLFLIPQTSGAIGEVRGNGEMFPLNGPHWSLFFEYIGNIMYALFIRRFSTKTLALWTAALGVVFAWFFVSDTVGYGNVGVGWTLDGHNFWGGLLRMSFSYSLGLLMSRLFRPMKIKGAFWLCSLLIVAFLTIPQINCQLSIVNCQFSANCLYEVLCIMLVFPLVVWMAASGRTTDKRSTKICSFLGDISYPLYAVHYPTMYIFYAYIGFPATFRTPGECWPWMIALPVGNILLAYALLKMYDEPVREWLKNHWLKSTYSLR